MTDQGKLSSVQRRWARQLALLGVLATVVAAPPAERAEAGSADVAALQVAMSALGLYSHAIDGIAGSFTQEAVRRFQRRNGLVVDGIAGRQTRRALGRRGRPRLGRRTMRRGHQGWDVAALQFLLRVRGFGQGGLDGGFGHNTAGAVRSFQRAAGLVADGVAGPATLSALRQMRLFRAPRDPVRFFYPVRAPIEDGFGWVHGRRHNGLDFPTYKGAPVSAAGRGVVAFAGWNSGGYGYLIVIRHRLGFETWYAHLSSIHAWPGQRVVGGTHIGHVGSTGFSTGPHLHFEARRFGTPVDPAPRMLAIAAAESEPVAVGAGRRSRRLRCRPNADTRSGRNVDPPRARIDRCP